MRSDESLVGFSYGIDTWDSWSKRLANIYGIATVLYDCFATAAKLGRTPSLEGYEPPCLRKEICISDTTKTDNDGRQFESFSAHLAPRGPRGTLLKIDVEGNEWLPLQSVSDSDLNKIDLLDVQFYPCAFLPDKSTPQFREVVGA